MQESKRSPNKRKILLLRSIALVVPLVCTLLLLSQTVAARNTYVITDGERVLVHTTHVTDPKAVLGEAGLELGEDDTYTTQHNQGVSEITVQRAAAKAAASAASPVTEVQTYTEAVPFETVYYDDPSLPAGVEKVLTQGKSGQTLCTASVTYENGVEVSRTLLQKSVRTHPTSQVVARGTASSKRDSRLPEIRDGLIYTAEGDVLSYVDVVKVRATAYSCEDYVTPGITYTGTEPRVGEIAVDPKVIPLGTRVFVVSDDGQYVYGVATAEDIGGGIKGNRIDLYYDTIAECFQFGDRACTVYILS